MLGHLRRRETQPVVQTAGSLCALASVGPATRAIVMEGSEYKAWSASVRLASAPTVPTTLLKGHLPRATNLG